MIRIKNPDILRERLLRTEAKIKDIATRRHRGGYCWQQCPEQRGKVKSLLIDRSVYLDRMFLATPAEVSRFEEINEKLIRMADEMHARAAMMWETLIAMKKVPEFDDQYEVEGILTIEGSDEDEEFVLRLPEDAYYGSDFLFMSGVLNEVRDPFMYQAHCSCYADVQDLIAGIDRDEEAFNNSLEDGQSWAEAALCYPALNHICICHPIHDICTHHPYSIPDLLRINDFKSRVTLTVHHETTQAGIHCTDPRFRTLKE